MKLIGKEFLRNEKLIGKEFLRNEVKLAWRKTSVPQGTPDAVAPRLAE